MKFAKLRCVLKRLVPKRARAMSAKDQKACTSFIAEVMPIMEPVFGEPVDGMSVNSWKAISHQQ